MLLVTMMMITIPTTIDTFAGGPRLDSPDGATKEGADCWVDGYDAGFAGKYDKDRANECEKIGDDNYNASWKSGCKDAGYMLDECASFKDNPVDVENPKSLEEENRRICYDDGYEAGEKNVYDREREFRCSEFAS